MAFTEGSPLQLTDVPDKKTVHGPVPKDFILGDLLSPRSSWEQGWHVSVVVGTTKKKCQSWSWMGTSPQGTIATAVKMSNARP